MGKTLTHHIANSPVQLWHILGLLSLLWVVPIFLPDSLIQQYAIVIVLIWVVGYIVVGHLIKRVIRTTTVDVILIERFFILLSFLVPTIMSTSYGLRNGFDGFVLATSIIMGIITLLLIVGIVLHVKNAKKYYHGVKKDELFR
jgi:hypothetical protein